MPQFFDMHCHMLSGVDDGAGSSEEMFAMLEMAYEDGIRAVCLTPHYSPYLFGDTSERSEKSFARLEQYVAQRHPDMRVFLGHELGYYHGCLESLHSGKCRTVAGSRYVLIDFPAGISFFELQGALDQLRFSGFFPILAHAERYPCLFHRVKWIEEFVSSGGLVQVNASSAIGAWGKGSERLWKKLIKKRLVHVISTDAHNTSTRPPVMSVCLPFLNRYCTPAEIRRLTWENACRIVCDKPI